MTTKTFGFGAGKKRKRVRCPYPLLDSNYFYPSPVNNIKADDHADGGPGMTFKFPRETYLEETKPLNFTTGEKLPVDVCSLLSNNGKTKSLIRNNGEKVGLTDAVAGKYLVVFCFFVPLLALDAPPDVCRGLIATYNDLKKKQLNFEMVMVAKMRCSFIAEDEEEPAFDRFFSAFPCLAVPYSESYTRDLICKLLGLGDGSSESVVGVVLDPDQVVLQENTKCFLEYGAASFPFTDDHLDSIDNEDEDLKMRLDPVYKESNYRSSTRKDEISDEPVTLEELLCCESSTILRKSGGRRKKKISISELSKKKCVALYLCLDGEFMSRLEWFRQKCVERNLQFDIVIVHLAHFSDEPSYFDAVKLALEEKGISWWELPFVDEVSRRLYRIGRSFCEDNVIIWADGGRSGELHALDFMDAFDSASIYPFTREKWLDDRLSSLRSLTLESFLGKNGRVYYYPGHGHLKVSDLKNRNILLYLGSSGNVYKKLRDSYEQIKKDYPGSEVVFVPMRKNSSDNLVPEIPWPRLSTPVNKTDTVVKSLWEIPALVAFGDDNQIKSLHAEDRLSYKEKGVSLFDDTLRTEVIRDLSDKLLR